MNARRDFDHTLLEVSLYLFRRQHIVKSIVKWPEIRIDLIAHIAREEAETLAGLDRRTR
jgi:hypothetical protein